MKNKTNRKFRPVLLGAWGTSLSFFVTILMATGKLQKVVHFRGVGEEIVFTFFFLWIGIISLGIEISCLTRGE